MWDFPQPPTVINGLLVVTRPDSGKQRLCLNPTYINMFIKYKPLHYEKVSDAASYVTAEDKSGYWHLAVHPDMYTYLAVQRQGVTYYNPVLAYVRRGPGVPHLHQPQT